MGDFPQVTVDKFGAFMGECDWRAEELEIIRTGDKMKREDLLMLHDKLCAEAKDLMVGKNQDYATNSDPFRNFRTFGELGILVRMSDKLARLRNFAESGQFAIKAESERDNVLDLINYAILLHGYLLDSGAMKVG